MLFRIINTISLAIAGFAMAPSVAHAEGIVTLDGDVKVIRIVEQNGAERETLLEPTQVVPGDRLVFTTSYGNDTGEAVDDFVITNPLPDAVMLAEGGDFSVSVDGGQNFAPLVQLTLAEEAGGTRAAVLADVTHLRWTLPTLAVGETGSVQYFATVR